jgi:hypothetical protein
MADKTSIVRRPYHGEYQEELSDDKKTETEINVSDSDKPSEEAATSEENPSDDSADAEETVEAGDKASQEEDTESTEATLTKSPEEPEAKVWKKRHDDGRRYQSKLLDRTKQLEQQLKEKGTVSLPKSKEEIDEWRQKFPDVYDIVSSIAAMQSDERTSNVQKQLEEVSQAQEEVVFERAYNKIIKVHSDFDELINDTAFHAWAETQPTTIQNALYENRSDSAAAIRAIDLYKYDQKLTKSKSTPKKDAAKAVTKTKTSDPVEGKEPKIWTEKEIHALSAAEYEKLEDEIDIAAREGRVVRA